MSRAMFRRFDIRCRHWNCREHKHHWYKELHSIFDNISNWLFYFHTCGSCEKRLGENIHISLWIFKIYNSNTQFIWIKLCIDSTQTAILLSHCPFNLSIACDRAIYHVAKRNFQADAAVAVSASPAITYTVVSSSMSHRRRCAVNIFHSHISKLH